MNSKRELDTIRALQNQLLTTIAERLSKNIKQSEVYLLMDDIIAIEKYYRGYLAGDLTAEGTARLLNMIGK